VLGIALLATAGVTLVARLLPDRWAASAVSACFFLLCYGLVLNKDSATIAHSGLRLGGLFEPAPLNAASMLKQTLVALGWASALSALVFAPFWIGYVFWWSPQVPFHPTLGDHFLEEVLGQVLVVALPEEMFFRGYLQSALDQARPPQLRVLGANVGFGVLWCSVIFALGHFTTESNFARLSVFFPSLVFGWLRSRTGGIGASVFFHAQCNLFAAFLARSYGLMP
jgi:membrane protease YdiL (CAAX protease family)